MALSGWLGLLDVKGGFCVQERRRFARRRKVEVTAIKTTEIKNKKKIGVTAISVTGKEYG